MPINISLSASEIVYAAIAALCLTLIIRNFIYMHRLMSKATKSFSQNRETLKKTLEKCYAIFPMDRFNFHGQVFKRGMRVKITTLQNKIFEGELIGFNARNMVCIMTSRLIVAHELCNIREIILLEENG